MFTGTQLKNLVLQVFRDLVLVGFYLPLMILRESRGSSSGKIIPDFYHCLVGRKPKNHHAGAAFWQVPALNFLLIQSRLQCRAAG